MKIAEKGSIIKIKADSEDRIDKVISNSLAYSRSKIQNWLEEGRVKKAGDIVRSKSKKIQQGELIELKLPRDNNQEVEAEEGPLDVVYSDEHLIAVNKPSGIIVHPAPGINTNTLVNRLLWHYPGLQKVGPAGRAGLVHRLDRGTSGLLLVARTDRVLNKLQEEFKNRRVRKMYRAILVGELSDDHLRVEVPVDRHPSNPTLRRAAPEGKKAVSVFERVATGDGMTAALVFPRTGRTHQIRIHSKYINNPVVGDSKYGGKNASRLMLHAEKLTFSHPCREARVSIEASMSGEVKKLWNSIAG